MRPPVISKRDGKEIVLPEAFIIEELEQQKNSPKTSDQPEISLNYQRPYWRPHQKEAQKDVIIIEL